MKRIIPILSAALLCGCSTTTLEMNGTILKSTSFMQKRSIAEVVIRNGTNAATMKGYRGTGDTEMLRALAEGAAEGAVKGAK